MKIYSFDDLPLQKSVGQGSRYESVCLVYTSDSRSVDPPFSALSHSRMEVSNDQSR